MRIKVCMVGTSQLSFPGPKEKIYAESVEKMQRNAQAMQFDFYAYSRPRTCTARKSPRGCW